MGTAGGFFAQYIGLPMAFLVGSLVTVSLTSTLSKFIPDNFIFPKRLRLSFVALIGAMIGTAFDPILFSLLDSLWVSLLAVAVFTWCAHYVGFLFYLYLGKLDKATAFFSAAPGGLVEIATMAEETEADTSVVLTLHSLRIILTVTCIPILFFLWNGDQVGSSTGVTINRGDPLSLDIIWLIALATIGSVIALLLRLPAPFLIGSILCSAGVSMTGFVDIDTPAWLLNLAQLIVGAGLGSQLVGLNISRLIKILWLGLIVIVLTTLLSGGFALVLLDQINQPLDVLFITMAPGGITEMSLIALSLGASPVYVASHHLFRIFITVITVGLITRFTRWVI